MARERGHPGQTAAATMRRSNDRLHRGPDVSRMKRESVLHFDLAGRQGSSSRARMSSGRSAVIFFDRFQGAHHPQALQQAKHRVGAVRPYSLKYTQVLSLTIGHPKIERGIRPGTSATPSRAPTPRGPAGREAFRLRRQDGVDNALELPQPRARSATLIAQYRTVGFHLITRILSTSVNVPKTSTSPRTPAVTGLRLVRRQATLRGNLHDTAPISTHTRGSAPDDVGLQKASRKTKSRKTCTTAGMRCGLPCGNGLHIMRRC